MKRIVFFYSLSILCILCFSINTTAQSSFAVVKTNGTTIITGTFQSALDTSSAGDIIYLPTGSLNFAGIIVNKAVNIIGAGYCPDSSDGSTTQIVSGLTFINTASGGSLTGVSVLGDFHLGTSDTDNGLANFKFQRCWFSSSSHAFDLNWHDNYENSSANNLTFIECIFDCWWTYVDRIKFVLYDRCVFNWSRVFNTDGNVSFKNCVFTHNDPGWNTLNTINGALFQNCIFATQNTGVSAGQNNTFINCLFMSPTTQASLPGQILTNNIYNFDSSKVFVSGYASKWPQPGSMCLKNLLYLTPQVKAAISGSDGKEIGIYGGIEPFKDGALPPIPAIKQAKVSSKSNAKGKIDIEFKVQAQTK